MTAIIYGCVCLATQKEKISISDMAGFTDPIKESVQLNDSDALLQYFSKTINIDPAIIPAYVKNIISKNNEEKEANKLCNSMVRLIRSPEKSESFDDYKSYMESLNAEIVGSEKIGAYACDIYEFKDPRTNATSKVWLWKDRQFPVKSEMTFMGNTVTTQMEEIKIDIPISDSEFTLPPSVDIIDHSGKEMY